jgi:hypothetical protein
LRNPFPQRTYHRDERPPAPQFRLVPSADAMLSWHRLPEPPAEPSTSTACWQMLHAPRRGRNLFGRIDAEPSEVSRPVPASTRAIPLGDIGIGELFGMGQCSAVETKIVEGRDIMETRRNSTETRHSLTTLWNGSADNRQHSPASGIEFRHVTGCTYGNTTKLLQCGPALARHRPASPTAT